MDLILNLIDTARLARCVRLGFYFGVLVSTIYFTVLFAHHSLQLLIITFNYLLEKWKHR